MFSSLAIVVLVLCYMLGSGGANQSDIYPKMLLGSGLPGNPKIMYVCMYVLQGVDFHFVLA